MPGNPWWNELTTPNSNPTPATPATPSQPPATPTDPFVGIYTGVFATETPPPEEALDDLEAPSLGPLDFSFKRKGAQEPEDARTEMDITKTKLSKIVKYRPQPPEGFPTAKQGLADLKALFAPLKLLKIPASTFLVPTIEVPKPVQVGIEIELENCLLQTASPTLTSDAYTLGAAQAVQLAWAKDQDDSLKNIGVEWISKVGLQAEDAPAALTLLNLYLKAYFNKVQLSYRCGTHVHIDVREFTVEQFINIVMLYVLFENTFYAVSGNRYKNYFCVPIRASSSSVESIFKLVHKPKPTFDDFRSIFTHFKKYMAFNLLPAGRNVNHAHYDPTDPTRWPLGTIEFRHHKGETSPEALTKWIQMIVDIHATAQEYSFVALRDLIFNLNTASNYLSFAHSIFTHMLPVESRDIVDDMYEGSSFIKEMYVVSKGA